MKITCTKCSGFDSMNCGTCEGTGEIEADENDRPGIHFKPIEYSPLPKGLPRYRILWRIPTGADQNDCTWEYGIFFHPIKKVFETLWFDTRVGLIGLKANGDLT